ncbi:hypothetical protein FGO68_gene1860 [Halteria grandinella]|uniref:glycerol-3-phosphate dehydrogenase n=1 Tax=Halteria grandinella TaxID=5974 RepID=A0A8J8NVD8_HALGN|nr:hypothetical protein FGO68_gene1860 [Halteria grandinella]
MKEIQDPKQEYDMLIVGGGANGAGVALEAASRGLKCAVIDSYDFASGTSSRSTKMAHGGIRYFEQMMKLEGDPFENFALLKETLHERNYFLMAAPYQNKQLKLLIPSTFLNSLFVYFPGCLAYHLMYLKQLMGSNYDVGVDGPSLAFKNKIRSLYPDIKNIHKLSGVLMHETQMMDGRMNLNALLTSSIEGFIPGMKGANLANYVEFRDYIKNAQTGKIEGAVLFDKLKQKEFKVRSKLVVNCAGIHADELRLKDNPSTFQRIIGAKGTHLIFKKGMLPQDQGIIIPKTRDGRLIFILNYLGQTMVGTTDEKSPITHHVQPDQTEIDFIISELKQVFGDDYDYQGNLESAWAGIRPLVKETDEDRKLKAEFLGIETDPTRMSILQKASHNAKRSLIWFGTKIHGTKEGTAAISRNHVIEFAPSGLVSVMGGKWTTFRKIGEEAVDMILRDKALSNGFEPKYKESQTLNFAYIGSYSRAFALFGIKQNQIQLFEQYEDHLVFNYDIPRECAKSLIHSYGTLALKVVQAGEQASTKQRKLNERLHPEFPFLKSEIIYAIKNEMVEKPNDIVCRRVPIGVLSKQAAVQIMPEVVEIMAKEKRWSNSQKKQELEEALANLQFIK